MGMPLQAVRRIRRACLARKLPLSRALLQAGSGPENAFLTNPSSQNAYVYLTHFVRRLSEAWFSKTADRLEVLDWGCGKGHVTLLLKEADMAVTACDVKAAEGSVILERIGQKIVPLEHDHLLPFGDGRFDAVVSFGVLEHVPDDVESLREIARVLRNDGLLFCFFVPYVLSWTQRVSRWRGSRYHNRLYGRRRIARILDQTGFGLLDLWHRQLLPKIRVRYPRYHLFESLDQFLTNCSPLKYLATNIEFVACKR